MRNKTWAMAAVLGVALGGTALGGCASAARTAPAGHSSPIANHPMIPATGVLPAATCARFVANQYHPDTAPKPSPTPTDSGAAIDSMDPAVSAIVTLGTSAYKNVYTGVVLDGTGTRVVAFRLPGTDFDAVALARTHGYSIAFCDSRYTLTSADALRDRIVRDLMTSAARPTVYEVAPVLDGTVLVGVADPASAQPGLTARYGPQAVAVRGQLATAA
jgi:hypothetical protein